MAVPTTYYNLLKPATGETYDVNLLDTNYDKIDAALNAINTTPPKTDNQLIFVAAAFNWHANVQWDAGVMHVDTGSPGSSQLSNPQPAFAQPGSVSGAIKILQAGMYDIHWLNAPDADPGASGYAIMMYGTWPGPPDAPNQILAKVNHVSGASGYYWESTITAVGVRVPTANLEIRLIGQQANITNNTPHVKVIQRSKF
jgi:hypothetical protein